MRRRDGESVTHDIAIVDDPSLVSTVDRTVVIQVKVTRHGRRRQQQTERGQERERNSACLHIGNLLGISWMNPSPPQGPHWIFSAKFCCTVTELSRFDECCGVRGIPTSAASGITSGSSEVGNFGPECCSVSDDSRLVGAVYKVDLKPLET